MKDQENKNANVHILNKTSDHIDDLKFCIFHAQEHARSLMVTIEAIAEFKKIQDQVPKSPIWYTLINTAMASIVNKIYILIEEHQDYFAQLIVEPDFRRQIGEVIREMKKIVPDYIEYRNQIGAHTMRKKRKVGSGPKESIFKQGREALYLKPYKLPTSMEEFNAIRQLCEKYLILIYGHYPVVILEIQDGGFPPDR